MPVVVVAAVGWVKMEVFSFLLLVLLVYCDVDDVEVDGLLVCSCCCCCRDVFFERAFNILALAFLVCNRVEALRAGPGPRAKISGL